MRAEARKRGLIPTNRATTTPSAPIWTPQAGPQAAAYASDADIIGYGGAAGGGKTDLLLGFAGSKHRRAIIFRRVFPLLEGIESRAREIYNAVGVDRQKDRYNETLHRWELTGGATVRFAAMQHEHDKNNFQGRPYDFYGFDEAPEFSESQFRFVTAWNRTTVVGQKCRVVLTFNPPMTDTGEWVVRYFAPWLDKGHINPAKDGELRWYVSDKDGKDQAVDGPEPITVNGKVVQPKSRTFFHAELKDNPILEATGYGATIDALPEPLRSFLRGNFDAAKVVDPWQTIPASWVRAAQARWTEARPSNSYVLGCDPARGGGDRLAIARLYGGTWFAPVETWPGTAVPDGPSAAALLAGDISAGASMGIDVIGIGASVFDSLKDNNASVQAINFGAGAGDLTDSSGRLRFRNVRAAAYWKLREALDPDHGDGLALPPDPELLADLCAPRYDLKPSGIQLEDKDGISARLGRSPDKGDALVLAYWTALYSVSDLIAW